MDGQAAVRAVGAGAGDTTEDSNVAARETEADIVGGVASSPASTSTTNRTVPVPYPIGADVGKQEMLFADRDMGTDVQSLAFVGINPFAQGPSLNGETEETYHTRLKTFGSYMVHELGNNLQILSEVDSHKRDEQEYAFLSNLYPDHKKGTLRTPNSITHYLPTIVPPVLANDVDIKIRLPTGLNELRDHENIGEHFEQAQFTAGKGVDHGIGFVFLCLKRMPDENSVLITNKREQFDPEPDAFLIGCSIPFIYELPWRHMEIALRKINEDETRTLRIREVVEYLTVWPLKHGLQDPQEEEEEEGEEEGSQHVMPILFDTEEIEEQVSLRFRHLNDKLSKAVQSMSLQDQYRIVEAIMGDEEITTRIALRIDPGGSRAEQIRGAIKRRLRREKYQGGVEESKGESEDEE